MAQTADKTPGNVSEEDRAIAENMLGTGQITPDRSRNHCLRTIKQGEIVVCAPDEEEFRVKSTAELDPNSPEALDDGRLHTPDVAGAGIFKGKATASFGSVTVPYIIDLSEIPEAPAGSDADKIAKGEMRAR
ncbi:hypothetical protein [Novosphingobium beihaiensis]|uniref:Uncharacterized protein n=1 Tax=Novosphingobium beihaiensis TaxID=2930389 RepID=A0ABT0BQB5_9SPHN|nr:hypothetical protein [Novosphingobium beihaiensis]MCJ2187242.1 hypothetical protein [Novosphingobium beihaiensis]